MTTDANNNRYPSNFNEGEDGWDDRYESNLDRLDREVIEVGALADRRDPTADQSPNWYFVTDTNVLYYNTGSAWVQRTDTHIRNALSFTDSTATGGAAIQAAIDDLPAGGGTVIVPANGPESDSNDNARWELGGHITLRSDIHLIGHGASLYLQDASDSNMLATNTAEGDPLVENVVIEGFSMDGNRANNSQWTRPDGTAVNPACVFCLESDEVTVRDCWFTSSRGYAVKFALSTSGLVENCYATDMEDDAFTATDTRYSSATSAYNEFKSCVAENNLDAGFEVDDGPIHTKFVNCVSIGNVEGFDVHTHDFTDTPASPRDTYYTNCTAINCDFGWRLGGNNHDDQAEGIYCSNINVEGSGIAAISAGNAGSSSDSVPEDVVVDGFVFEHPSSASTAAIDLRSPNGVSGWTFSNGVVKTARRGLGGDNNVQNLTLSNVEFDCSSMANSLAESGVELNAGSSGTVRNITLSNVRVHGATNSGVQLWSGGGALERVEITGGRYYNNGQDNTGSAGAAGISINDNGAAPTEITVRGANCYDDQGTKTQETGIYWNGVTNSTFVGNVLVGNGTNATDGTLGTNSTSTANIT